MKKLFFIILLIGSSAFCRGQDSIQKRIGHMICYVLRSEDPNEFLKISPTKTDYIDYFIKKHGEENRSKIVAYVEETYNEKAFTEPFERVMGRGKELGIQWHTLSFSKIICDTVISSGNIFYKGDIWFTAGGKNWMIKFQDCFFVNNKIDIYLYMPFYNKIPDNIERCSKYKDEYMQRCIAGCKKSLEVLPPEIISTFQLYKPTIEEYCLDKFNDFLKFDDCDVIIKNAVDWSEIKKTKIDPSKN